MTSAVLDTSPTTTELAEQVYQLLVAIDPATWRADVAARARVALAEVRRSALAHLESWRPTEKQTATYVAFEQLATTLPDPGDLSDRKSEWAQLRDRVALAYEALAVALKAQGEEVHHLRPANRWRSVVHALGGLSIVAGYQLLLTPKTAIIAGIAWCVWAWSLEVARRNNEPLNDLLMRFFGAVSRPHERYRVNSATWFGTAMLILTLTAPPWAAVLGVLGLALGDPMAGIIGRRWGRTKLVNRRTLEGSSAFFATSFVAGLVWLALFHPLGWPMMIALAAGAALVGALTETFSTRIDDNLAVPVVTAWGVALLGLVLGAH